MVAIRQSRRDSVGEWPDLIAYSYHSHMNERVCYCLSLPCGWLFGMGTAWLEHVMTLNLWGPVASRFTGGVFLFLLFFLPLLFVVGGPPVTQSFKELLGRLPASNKGAGYWRTKLPIFFRLTLWFIGLAMSA